jgi:hypothetical protein
MHPGGEHGEDAPGLKRWNARAHRRKFLSSGGLLAAGPRDEPREGDIAFWGEWEPESQVDPILERVPGGPRWLHRPYYVRPDSYRRDGQVLQNTDPFVFGDTFFYTLCRQVKPRDGVWRPTFLRDLAPGSLILFGSLKGGEFVLDTVYVVAGGVLHDSRSWESALAGMIPGVYADVTMRPSYEWGDPGKLRLYRAAMYSNPLNGMFSFVPALPLDESEFGFARPAISLPGVVTPGLMMGAKRTRDLTLDQLRGLWDEVVAQVLAQGLQLAVRIALPEVGRP